MKAIEKPEADDQNSEIEVVKAFDSGSGRVAGPMDPLESRLGDRLEKTADEAKMLLRYASMNGVEVPDETSKEICEADARCADGTSSTPEEEVRFFAAFRELSSLVAPVSVDTLIACDDLYAPERTSFFTRRMKKRCAAKRAASKFMLITLIILVMLLGVQSYWFVGQRILQQFEAATLALQTREFLANRMNTAVQDGSGDVFSSGVATLGPSKFSKMDEDELRNVISGYGVALSQWSAWMEWIPKPDAAQMSTVTAETASISTEEPDGSGDGASGTAADKAAEPAGDSFDDFEAESDVGPKVPEKGAAAAVSSVAGANRTYRVMMVGSVLDVIQSFVLPLIYGLIGACAYVLRALVTETHEKTYLPEKAGGYMLRLTLGLLAGLGVGYLFKDQITGDSALGALSPLALAFVAGYSVELLFSVMDRMIPKSAAE